MGLDIGWPWSPASPWALYNGFSGAFSDAALDGSGIGW